MKIPTFPKLNYAMHLLGSCFVELFPKLQLLDLIVYPDRFCIDFSFSRTLSIEEIHLLKQRFFEKIKRKQRGDIREMVSKNACDLLKHYKQIFLTGHVDREEMFTDMLCMDVYNAPVRGALQQDLSAVKELKLEMSDLGEKKWMKRKVYHYRMEAFTYFSNSDAKIACDLNSKSNEKDHQVIGINESLFWVNEGEVFFSEKGEGLFQNLLHKASIYFGDLVYFSGNEREFFTLSKLQNFSIYHEVEGSYNGVCYGLKETECIRSITSYNFSNKDSEIKIKQFTQSLGLSGEFNEEGDFIVYDYKGISWNCVKVNKKNKYLILEINLQRYFALMLENKIK